MTDRSPLARLEKKVAAIMGSKDRFPVFSLATLLSGGAILYGAGMRLRESFYGAGVLPQHRLPCRVVSIGNLAVGGSGKTPLTIHLATQLQTLGQRVMIVSRGYKGEGERRGNIVSDGHVILCNESQAGDEPFLMATLLKSVPVVVGRDRWAMGRGGLARFKPDVILLDDAFQHRRLARDVNLVLLDFQAPLGNGHLLPRGSLREPVSALDRADAIIFTRCAGDESRQHKEVVKRFHPRPIFHARHNPVVRCIVPAGQPLSTKALIRSTDGAASHLSGRSLFAFAGLARNQEFYRSVERMGGRLVGTRGFADHHAYEPRELEQIATEARQSGCHAIATSDKDFVRLPGMIFPLDLIVLGVDIDFGADAASWSKFIGDRIGQEPIKALHR